MKDKTDKYYHLGEWAEENGYDPDVDVFEVIEKAYWNAVGKAEEEYYRQKEEGEL